MFDRMNQPASRHMQKCRIKAAALLQMLKSFLASQTLAEESSVGRRRINPAEMLRRDPAGDYLTLGYHQVPGSDAECFGHY